MKRVNIILNLFLLDRLNKKNQMANTYLKLSLVAIRVSLFLTRNFLNMTRQIEIYLKVNVVRCISPYLVWLVLLVQVFLVSIFSLVF